MPAWIADTLFDFVDYPPNITPRVPRFLATLASGVHLKRRF
jgi:hypothetical protein